MPKVAVTFACGLYDRMSALYTGEVKPEGIDFNFLVIDEPRQIFDRMGKNLEFDACEMSSTEVFSRLAAGRNEMVALPVFPSRVFRHGFITVNRKAVKAPKDLEGKRIGVPLYTQTAAVFIRGCCRTSMGSICRACIGCRAPPTARTRMAIRRHRRSSSKCLSNRTRPAIR